MTIKHRLAKLEQRIDRNDEPLRIQLITPPNNLTPAEQQAFAERNTVTVTMRTLKRILRDIAGKTIGPPGQRQPGSASGGEKT